MSTEYKPYKFYYHFDNNFFYTEQYIYGNIQPANSTNVEPITYNNKLEQLKLTKERDGRDNLIETWIIVDKIINGDYYNIKDGTLNTQIIAKERDQYTTIKPTLEINEGDTIAFNATLEQWNYVTKGQITQDKLKAEALQLAKEEKKRLFLEFITKSQVEQGCIFLDIMPSVYVIDSLKNIQEVLKNKISNGDLFDYHIKSIKKTITNIPKAQAISLAHAVENHLTALGAYKRFYLGFNDNNVQTDGEIDKVKSIEELSQISFKNNMYVAKALFEVQKLNLIFQMQEDISIVDTYEK